jgi:hypothetical protein
MDLDAIEAARDLLLDETQKLSSVGYIWRVHAAMHLAEQIDRELRGGARRWSGEDQAIALVKAGARDLEQAAKALLEAAEQFRTRGHGWQANRAYHAAQGAAKAAQALDPA